ncbi:hypothetical protein [Aquimarina intermedia]|uniref:hypothetical protein n=1 Tax=Aquimarina intermedia TaxID=350814 RepID=UPI0011E65772|nr:hypothetical protein [Aquimarina intermedia]
MKLDPSTITPKLIEELIMRCYTIDHTLRVTDAGKSWAQLKYGLYSFKAPNKKFSGRIAVGIVQRNLSGLIRRYKNFEYQGVRYYYDRGRWRVSGFD